MVHFNYLLVLIVISLVLSVGIHIFSRGFLLTRIANENKSSCRYFFNSDGKCYENNKVRSIYTDYVWSADDHFRLSRVKMEI